MDIPPHERDPAALERLTRRYLRDVRRFGIVLAVFSALTVWRILSPSDPAHPVLDAVRDTPVFFFSIVWLLAFRSFAAKAMDYGRVRWQIVETHSIRNAIATHRDLPPATIARLAAKTWQWRALCLTGTFMILGLGLIAWLIYLNRPAHGPLLSLAIFAMMLIVFWSTLHFAAAAMRFVRAARPEKPAPAESSNR
jgi:hypothetical protein